MCVKTAGIVIVVCICTELAVSVFIAPALNYTGMH